MKSWLSTGPAADAPADALLLRTRPGADNVSSWFAPGPGKVSIDGYAGIAAGVPGRCREGIAWTIHRNDDAGKPLFSTAVASPGPKAYVPFRIDGVTVGTGDAIRFRASSEEKGGCSRGVLSARIVFAADDGASPAGRPFIRGDVNGDGGVDISDAIAILGFLFQGSPATLACRAAADTNDDDSLDLTDAIGLLAFKFQGGKPPAEPAGACGLDPTQGRLTCEGSRTCP